MKRYLAILLCLTGLLCCLCMSVSAEEFGCTLSDDLETLYYDGEAYTKVNVLAFNCYYTIGELPLELTAAQQARYSAWCAYWDESECIVEVTLVDTDGTRITLGYLKDSRLEEFSELLSDTEGEFLISHYGDDIPAAMDTLKGTPVTLDQYTSQWSDYFPVGQYMEGTDLMVTRGTVLIDGRNYYYVDHEENGIVDRAHYLTPDFEGAAAYKIQDPELCAAIKGAQSSMYDVEIWDDDGTNTFSAILLALVFGLLPCGVAVTALIFAVRCKGFYRKAWAITAGLAGATVLVFIILAAIFLLA